MIFRILASLLFIAIIAGSFWLGGQQREAAPTTTVENPSGDPGYSARTAVLIETGPDGQPMYTLNADVIRQHPGNGVEFDKERAIALSGPFMKKIVANLDNDWTLGSEEIAAFIGETEKN